MAKRIMMWIQLVSIFGNPGIAQPRFVYSKPGFTDTLYNIASDRKARRQTGYCFPEYDYYSRNITGGYPVIRYAGNQEQATATGNFWRLNILSPLVLKKDTTGIYYRVYAINIRSCSFYACFPEYGMWLKKEVEIGSDGYQSPDMSYFSQWTAVTDSERVARHLTGDGSAKKDLPHVLVVATPADIRQPCEWTFGELLVGQHVETMTAIRHPFFDALMTKAGQSSAAAGDPDISPGALQSQFIVRSNLNYNFRDLIGKINVEGIETEQEQRRLLLSLLDKALEEYPFYKERRRSLRDIRGDFDRMVNALQDSSLCTLADSIRNFINTSFSDPHFGLLPPTGCRAPAAMRKVRPGIRLYRIGKGVFVSAIFDTLYAGNMQVGDRVKSINGKNIDSLLDDDTVKAHEVSEKYYDVSALLDGKKTDRVNIVTVGGNGEKTTLLRYDKPYAIPENFRSKPFSLEIDNEQVACLRFNQWSLDLYSRLISQWDKISHAKGLIIDLRGNGGGELISPIRVLALFIDHPTVLFNGWTRTSVDPLIVRSDTAHHFPGEKNVMILVDGGTACASECFIAGMQTMPNVQVIGNTHTYGALASRYDIVFPDGMDLYIDCVTQKMVLADNTSIEGTGIQPRIKVPIGSVEDLQPYRDIVLSTARGQILHRPIANSVTGTGSQ
jgi:C-terminal processing protease CtpA/Prc